MSDVLTFAAQNLSQGKKVALVTVTETSGSSLASEGQMMAVLAEGKTEGGAEKTAESLVKENSPLIRLLAGVGQLDLSSVPNPASQDGKCPEGAIALAGNGFEAFVFIAEVVDIKFLKEKFTKELEKDRRYVEGLKARLANENFLKNAPPELVAGEKLKLEESLKRTGKLESYVRDMAIQ